MKKITNRVLDELCSEAKGTAITAGKYIQSMFDQHYVKDHKEGGDSLASQVVTAVDLKAQEIILERLQRSIEQYDLGLLTEELADDQSRTVKDYFWCIDPMDGTLPFTEHRTGYAVSIALISCTGDPVVGVVYIPDLELCYTSVKGAGVRLNDEPFARAEAGANVLHWYMDRSFESEPYFELVKSELEQFVKSHSDLSEVQLHVDFGGVRNAISVMSLAKSCYFKFPKEQKGCGSIWDYAATRLFMEEIGLSVSDASGSRLHLNNPENTFMNEVGILYATYEELTEFLIRLGEKVVGDK